MKLIYTPKDGDPRTFDLGPLTSIAEDMSWDEAEAVEDAGQLTWETFAKWQSLLLNGGFRAWRVMLWILLRRENPALNLNEVKPFVSELTYDFDEPADSEGKGSESGEPDGSDTASASPPPASGA